MDLYMLLDRSGSMQNRWGETISAINGYVEQLRTDLKDDRPVASDPFQSALNAGTQEHRVTLAVFDEMSGIHYDVLRDRQSLRD